MDKAFDTGMILVDLQKPFDTLDHTVLLQKWNEFVSRCQSIRCWTGVPQRSILGPLLFLKYINDLPQALNETGSCLYADDTCIFYQDKYVAKIEKSLCEWFVRNKLSTHFGDDEAKTIFFSLKKSPPKFNISYGDYSLKQHNTVEYLRCYLDSDLNGEPMVCRVLKRLTQS